LGVVKSQIAQAFRALGRTQVDQFVECLSQRAHAASSEALVILLETLFGCTSRHSGTQFSKCTDRKDRA